MSLSLLKYPLLLLVAIAFSACKNSATVQETPSKNLEKTKPGWMTERPFDQDFYIGIGSASKINSPLDYAQVAKKNALSDLSSEIKVTVSENSFLNTVEINQHFQEEFSSNIQTSSLEEIVGHEQIGNWENENEYWVLYRLSKSEHARIKAEKKNSALQLATLSYQQGLFLSSQGEISRTLDAYCDVIKQLTPYLGEPNQVEIDGSSIYIDKEAFAKATDLLLHLKITSATERIILYPGNQYSENLEVYAQLDNIPVNQLPLTYHYDRNKYYRKVIQYTDDKGHLPISISEADPKSLDNRLRIGIDIDNIVARVQNKELVAAILNDYQPLGLSIPIQLNLPRFYISSVEKVDGELLSEPLLAPALQNSLNKQGWSSTQNESESDYQIILSANTSKATNSGDFYISYLDMNIEVSGPIKDYIYFTESKNSIKGLQLNPAGSSKEAYKKGIIIIENEITDALIKALL